MHAEPLRVTTGLTNDSADPDTPTWSASSEASDFASVEAHSSPAAVTASTHEQQAQGSTMGQQAQARLAGRFGGWLTGVTNAAGQCKFSWAPAFPVTKQCAQLSSCAHQNC